MGKSKIANISEMASHRVKLGEIWEIGGEVPFWNPVYFNASGFED